MQGYIVTQETETILWAHQVRDNAQYSLAEGTALFLQKAREGKKSRVSDLQGKIEVIGPRDVN